MGASYNPRRIDPDQLLALRRSLRTFGAVEPVVANRRTAEVSQ
jgi:ParB-like chromosome segregation protein Spo0J